MRLVHEIGTAKSNRCTWSIKYKILFHFFVCVAGVGEVWQVWEAKLRMCNLPYQLVHCWYWIWNGYWCITQFFFNFLSFADMGKWEVRQRKYIVMICKIVFSNSPCWLGAFYSIAGLSKTKLLTLKARIWCLHRFWKLQMPITIAQLSYGVFKMLLTIFGRQRFKRNVNSRLYCKVNTHAIWCPALSITIKTHGLPPSS